MSELPTHHEQELGRAYFGLPTNSLWRWVEQGQVLEWHSGDTLCYRDELAGLLHGLAGQGLPPLPTVLLLLAACAESWPTVGGGPPAITLQVGRWPTAPNDPSDEQVRSHLQQVLGFMATVRALPADLRTGAARLHLFREVCQAQAPFIVAEFARPVLEEWTSGRLTYLQPPAVSRRSLLRDTAGLASAAGRFPDADALARYLRTGLPAAPQAGPELAQLLGGLLSYKLGTAATEAVEAPAPAPPTDLFDQLAQDPRTAGLATLARQLLAALRVPPHTQGAGEQPLGGVADLSNRGPLDRLLLSELAHDDLTLLARLANQEALYLRREEPPQPARRPHALLLDTTLRLWGLPRVFGLAAALAWARQAGGPGAAPAEAWALGGLAATPLRLDSPDGVVQALSQLDPAPHCAPALRELTQQPALTQVETVFITTAEALALPELTQALADGPPRYVLALSRAGDLTLYEYRHGHRHERTTARFDLAGLLHTPAPAPRPLPPPRPLPTQGPLPAFVAQDAAALFFPTPALRLAPHLAYYSRQLGVLAISEAARLLHWPGRDTGAREVLPAVAAGSYFLASDEQSYFVLLVSGSDFQRVYKVDAQSRVRRFELPAPGAAPRLVAYHAHGLYLAGQGGFQVFDCQLGELRAGLASALPEGSLLPGRHELAGAKPFINNGYNTVQRLKRLGLQHGQGQPPRLVLNNWQLRVWPPTAASAHGTAYAPGQTLELTPLEAGQAGRLLLAAPGEGEPLPTNPQVQLRCFDWPGQVQAVLDTRGLLHLRSLQCDLPEVTLVLATGQPTAAWAADGTVCGSPYFTGPQPWRLLSGTDFYAQYLDPYLQRLAASL